MSSRENAITHFYQPDEVAHEQESAKDIYLSNKTEKSSAEKGKIMDNRNIATHSNILCEGDGKRSPNSSSSSNLEDTFRVLDIQEERMSSDGTHFIHSADAVATDSKSLPEHEDHSSQSSITGCNLNLQASIAIKRDSKVEKSSDNKSDLASCCVDVKNLNLHRFEEEQQPFNLTGCSPENLKVGNSGKDCTEGIYLIPVTKDKQFHRPWERAIQGNPTGTAETQSKVCTSHHLKKQIHRRWKESLARNSLGTITEYKIHTDQVPSTSRRDSLISDTKVDKIVQNILSDNEVQNPVNVAVSQIKETAKIHSKIKNPFLFWCALCNRGFLSAEEFQCHVKKARGRGDYKCDICNKKFTITYVLRQHDIRFHNRGYYECCVCGDRFQNILILFEHKDLNHRAIKCIPSCFKCRQNTTFYKIYHPKHIVN